MSSVQGILDSIAEFFWFTVGTGVGIFWTLWYWMDKYILNLKVLVAIFVAILLFWINLEMGISFVLVVFCAMIIDLTRA